MPEGLPPAAVVPPPGQDAADAAAAARRALRVQMLATEHWSLLATRSLSWNEAFSRASMFLSLLSGAVVALALVAQAVQRHRGTVDVGRSPLGGARFDIVIDGPGENPPSPTGVTTVGTA